MESESDFQQAVVELARLCGWRAMHVRRSVGRRRGGAGWQTTTSVVGWPDLFLWHPRSGRVVVAELKSEKGRLTVEQRGVLDELEGCGLDTRVWRPADWPEIEKVLTEGRHR